MIIIIIIKKEIGINSMSSEKKSGKNTGENFVGEKFSHLQKL